MPGCFKCAGCDKVKANPPAGTFMGLPLGRCCEPGIRALMAEANRGNVCLSIEVQLPESKPTLQ
jgi:hypothetical protein